METTCGKILLIDDDPFFLKVMSDAFRESGLTVLTAHDGVEGIQSFIENFPEVVISDMIMPRMGGVSTCLEIARLSTDPEQIIILLTSMFQGAPHEHEIAELGARFHISKSTKPLDIIIIVEQLLDRKKYRQLAG